VAGGGGGGLDSLKMILQQEIINLLSRIADRNDIIRINTLRWVLEVIEKLEHER
jgi:hypothetical protein